MDKSKKTSTAHIVWTVIGIVLCVILVPILIVNITLIIKSYTKQDEVPTVGGWCPLIVMTGSMETEISSGDLIFVHQIDANDVRKNDIIAFFDPSGDGSSVVTHRVIEVTQKDNALAFRTKGDANNTEDTELVTADKLVGQYQWKIGGGGYVAMFMQSTPGLIICVVVPLILLVGYDLIRRRHFEKANKQDTDALLKELEELKAQKAQTDNSSKEE